MTLRSRRPQYQPGSYYHLYNRGARQLTIFREEENYLYVTKLLKSYRAELELAIVAYCLMPTHYHILVRQDGDHPAGLLAQRIFNSYSKAYNRRYKNSGTLFESPYKVVEVTSEVHLRHLCRYIHVNPVKDGLVENPGDWTYSNYRDWVGLRAGTLVNPEFIDFYFDSTLRYIEFVEDYSKDLQFEGSLLDYID